MYFGLWPAFEYICKECIDACVFKSIIVYAYEFMFIDFGSHCCLVNDICCSLWIYNEYKL